MTNQSPVEIDGITGEVETLPPKKEKRYRCKLDTLHNVKKEMAKIYRESKTGLIDVQDGTKFIWMLQSLAKTIEAEKIEQKESAIYQPISLDDFYNREMKSLSNAELEKIVRVGMIEKD